MRLPFNIDKSDLNEDARIKFIYTSPELHQNIEISIDGDKTSVEALLDAFERFLGALGVSIPDDVMLQFIRIDDEDDEIELEEDEDLEEDDEDDRGENGSKK